MAELRWALLLAGLLFVAGLVVWERRKRRAREAEWPGHPAGAASPQEGASGAARAGREAAGDGVGREEPAFSMPDLPRRDPVRDLPIVEIDSRAGSDPAVGDLPVFDMGQSNRVAGGSFGDGRGDGGIMQPPARRPASRTPVAARLRHRGSSDAGAASTR